MSTLKNLITHGDTAKLKRLLSCSHAFVTQEAVSVGLPDFPLDNLTSIVTVMVNSFHSEFSPSIFEILFYTLSVIVGQVPIPVGVRCIL